MANTIVLEGSATGIPTGTSPLTWNHSVSSFVSNRLLVVQVGLDADSSQPSATSVSYNGVALTKVQGIQNNNGTKFIETSIWYLHNAAIGTNQVSVVFSGGINTTCFGGSSLFSGAQQFDTANSIAGRSGSATGFAQETIFGEDDNAWVFATIIDANSASASVANIWGGTQTWNTTLRSGNSVAAASANGPESTDPGTVNWGLVGGWTINNGNLWAMAESVLVPASAKPLLSLSTQFNTVTTSENINIAQVYTIHASDTATTSDAITSKPDVSYQIIKADTAQTGEGVTIGTQIVTINVFESESLTEFLKLIAEANVKFSDNPVTSEFQKLLVDENIASSDTVTTSEFTQATIIPLLVDVSDSATTQEHLGLILSIADYQVFQGDLVSTSEFVQLLIPQLLASVSDSTTISESTTVFVTELFAQVFDTTTASEFIQFFISLPVTVGDGASTNESLDVMRANTRDPSISDTVQASELIITRTSDYFRAIQDTVTVTDASTVSGPITAPRLVIHKEIIEFTANTNIFLTLVMD